MSSKIRDGIICLLKNILPMVQMMSTTTTDEKEVPQLLRRVPTIRPFDLSMKLKHLLSDSAWQSRMNRIGFDIYLI